METNSDNCFIVRLIVLTRHTIENETSISKHAKHRDSSLNIRILNIVNCFMIFNRSAASAYSLNSLLFKLITIALLVGLYLYGGFRALTTKELYTISLLSCFKRPANVFTLRPKKLNTFVVTSDQVEIWAAQWKNVTDTLSSRVLTFSAKIFPKPSHVSTLYGLYTSRDHVQYPFSNWSN